MRVFLTSRHSAPTDNLSMQGWRSWERMNYGSAKTHRPISEKNERPVLFVWWGSEFFLRYWWRPRQTQMKDDLYTRGQYSRWSLGRSLSICIKHSGIKDSTWPDMNSVCPSSHSLKFQLLPTTDIPTVISKENLDFTTISNHSASP